MTPCCQDCVRTLNLFLLNFTKPSVNELEYFSCVTKHSVVISVSAKCSCAGRNSVAVFVMYSQVSPTKENLEESRHCVSGLSYL